MMVSPPIVTPLPDPLPNAVPVRRVEKSPEYPPLFIRVDPSAAPTPTKSVKTLLRIANPRSQDVVYDAGCGDGRILIHANLAYGCRAVGIELDSRRVSMARANVAKAGCTDVRVIQGDATKMDYSDATIVTMYLTDDVMRRIVPRLLPGTIVLSYLHSIPDVNCRRFVDGKEIFYLYEVPDPAGWKL
jgi:SAM-dependent methyltransferase